MASQICWYEKNVAQRVLIWGNGAQYGLHEKIFAQKIAQKFSGKFGEIRAKILRTPKNLPAATPVVNSMKLGAGKGCPYDASLEGITGKGDADERNSFGVGELGSFSEDPAEWKYVSTDLRKHFAENMQLEQDLGSLNVRTSART